MKETQQSICEPEGMHCFDTASIAVQAESVNSIVHCIQHGCGCGFIYLFIIYTAWSP